MALSRTTADYVTAVLRKCGEDTGGSSQYTADVLEYLNKVHMTVISGGTLFDVDVDDNWTWALSRNPYVITLQPKYNTGTVTFTNGSTSGTFSSAPTSSLKGWHLRVNGQFTTYKIMSHTASSTAFSIDSSYVDVSAGALSYVAFKLDYDVIPEQIYVETGVNDAINFIETGTTQRTATLPAGSYTPTAYATAWAAALNAAGVTGNTYTASFSAVTNLFTITSNLSGSGSPLFSLLGASGTNSGTSAMPAAGFDYLDSTGAASYVSTYKIGAVSHLVGPLTFYQGLLKDAVVEGIDPLTMQEDYPVGDATEGVPRRFAAIQEDKNGIYKIRLDRYVSQQTKIEIPHVPEARDLQNNTVSVPRIPRKYSDILEYGAAFFLATDKNDDKAPGFHALAAAMLKTMQKNNRAQLKRISQHYGEITPRKDLTNYGRRRFRYGYTVNEE